MGLRDGAEFAVVIEVDPRVAGQAERGGGAGVGAISAFADALHGDALRTETDGDRAEALGEIVDELAVGGEVENLLLEDPVMSDLGSDQEARTLRERGA